MTKQAKALSAKDNGTDDWPIDEDMLRIIQQMGEREREAVDWPARTVLRLLATIEDRDKRIAAVEKLCDDEERAAPKAGYGSTDLEWTLTVRAVRSALKGKHDAD